MDMVRKSFQMGNNFLYTNLFLFSIIFISCNSPMEDKKEQRKSDQQSSFFVPDTTLNNIIPLLSAIKNNIAEEIDVLPFYNDKKIIRSKDGVFLVLQGNYGGEKGTFQYFDVFHEADTSYKILADYGNIHLKELKYFQSNFENFKTESGISLGMKKEELIRIKGKDYVVESQLQFEILTYTIDDVTSDFLSRHNLPMYEMKFFFEDGILRRFSFGFPTP